MNETTPRLNQYKCLIFLASIYMTLGICCPTLLGKKIISTHFGIVSASSMFSPFFYILDDIFAEIYGYDMARRVFIMETLCEPFFVIFCNMFIKISLADSFQNTAYIFFFKNSFYSELIGILGYIVAWYINIRLLIKWKILTKGKYFWLRSVGSSSINIVIFMLLIIPSWIFFSGMSSLHDSLQLAAWSCFLKLTFLAIFAVPFSFIVQILKLVENIKPEQERSNPFVAPQTESTA